MEFEAGRAGLATLNGRVRSLFAALYPCRFTLLAIAVPGLALVTVPQLQECLRALAERSQIPFWSYVQWAALYLSALYWAASAWYWTRQLMNFRFVDMAREDAVFLTAQALLPRIIGSAGLALLAVALYHASEGYGAIAQGAFARSLKMAALASAALGLAFYLFVHFRRRLFNLPPVAAVRRARELPRPTRFALGVAILVTVGFFFAAWLAPLAMAPRIGAIAILLIAAAAWCTAGSLAVFADGRYGIPVLPIAVAGVVLFSLWNDDHALRGTGTPPPVRPTLNAYASDWLGARLPALAGPRPYPVVVVATAGGGIRAAYWTGSLLAALEDRYGSEFGEHLFAISGVSGGSLGAATYVALRADRLTMDRARVCAGDPTSSLKACASALLSQDFLAPVVGSMLFPDLVQRFLPVPVPSFDRGRVLEQSWEQAWVDQGLPDAMAAPFYGLWTHAATRGHAPLLFLNSTLVETGQRVIVSPVELPAVSQFYGARELHTLSPADLPLSSAAHLSARFTYVSPAATVSGADGRVAGHLVDGGYFENTGADTAAGVVAALRTAATGSLANIEIYVLLISNEPGDALAGALPEPERWLTEARAPLAALLNARDARGREAATDITQLLVTADHALRMGLSKSTVTLPLGWTLSDAAQCEIDRQLAAALDAPPTDSAVAVLDSLLPVVAPRVRPTPGCS